MTLRELGIGKTAVIKTIGGEAVPFVMELPNYRLNRVVS